MKYRNEKYKRTDALSQTEHKLAQHVRCVLQYPKIILEGKYLGYQDKSSDIEQQLTLGDRKYSNTLPQKRWGYKTNGIIIQF